jgi:hypothetical protein
MQEILCLSNLQKTWLLDLDGTIVKHNGYKTGKDELLPGAREFLEAIPEDDFIFILTARKKEYRAITERFLLEQGIRYNELLFDIPIGERIVLNDRKPSGLKMTCAVDCKRDEGLENIKIVIDNNL